MARSELHTGLNKVKQQAQKCNAGLEERLEEHLQASNDRLSKQAGEIQRVRQEFQDVNHAIGACSQCRVFRACHVPVMCGVCVNTGAV